MGKTFIPTDYDKYFNFDLIDYANFDINIPPPIPPPPPIPTQDAPIILTNEEISENIEDQIFDEFFMETDHDMNFNSEPQTTLQEETMQKQEDQQTHEVVEEEEISSNFDKIPMEVLN